MADKVKTPGRLIAVDGSRGKDVDAGAKAIAAALKHDGIDCAVSRWDASGLFTELAAGADDQHISARTLALVYAADLAFRLRWEIRPILESGGVVIASNYIDTAIAFGSAAGLSADWLRQLLRFAPAPDFRGRSEERKIDRPWKKRADRGYPEYCALMLDGAVATKKVRRGMMAALEHGRGKTFFNLTAKGVHGLAAAVTGSRKAGPRRSTSRPRNARK